MMMMMDKGGGGGVGDDMGEGMQCSDHPYKKNPGGICAFCLQEKLGKLVSSSKSNPSFFPGLPSTSSSSPSFRSEVGGVGSSSLSLSVSVPPSSSSNNNNDYDHHHPGRHRIPFLLAQKKPKKMAIVSCDANLVLKRSKSSAAPRRRFFDADEYSLRNRGFWSFLHLSSRRRNNRERDSKPSIHPTTTTTISTTRTKSKDKGGQPSSSSRSGDYVEDNESSNNSHTPSSSFCRKVARSRSVGCGSRSFSGDFLERISTGFGDCALRRVESQREVKPKIGLHHHHHHRGVSADEHHRIKERVKCGGIFSGFSMSSSFSSSYWQSTSAEDMNGRSAPVPVVATGVPHSRSKSWGWAFASPMKALSRPPKSNEDDRRDIVTHSNTSTTTNNPPNLAAIPSLLAVRG